MSSNAVCLIPPTVFSRGLPVSASIELPPNTTEVWWWFIVAPNMQQTAEFRGLAETRWGTSSGNFTDSSVTTTRVEGSEGAIPGGIAGGLPGQLPNVVENFTFEPRSSGGGGAGIDPGAERVRLTIIPESGNNNGPIWCGAVIQATDENGNFLLFDVTTKGS